MKERIHNNIHTKTFRQNLRNDATKAERIVWKYIRNSQLGGYKFRRQHGIGPYIVDFYCAPLQLILELDGWVHGEKGRRQKDAIRQQYLEDNGFLLIRYKNAQIRYDFTSVLEDLYNKCTMRASEINHP